jgi:hypothetical protein
MSSSTSAKDQPQSADRGFAGSHESHQINTGSALQLENHSLWVMAASLRRHNSTHAGRAMSLLPRVILTLAVAVLGAIQAVIFTAYYYFLPRSPRTGSGDTFDIGVILNIFVSIMVFVFVFSALFVFLIIGYRESMALRRKCMVLTLALSVGSAIAFFEARRESWAIGYSAAAFFIGTVWTFVGTRKSVGS